MSVSSDTTPFYTTAQLKEATSKRRTFAIISHPDAGKTTLTEKLLLYSGMVRTAGMVRARKGGKTTSSDWMAMEQERGISITSSAMQFHYKGIVINLLDTPGHQDFSEDTYRTLTAADCAVMVIDAAKGVETQTKKLFEVCRLRGIPTITFVNKMDLPARDIFELLDEVETVLGVKTSPVNWPIGSGKHFKGVVSIADRNVSLFSRSAQGGAARAETETLPLETLLVRSDIDEDLRSKVRDDLELLEVAGNPFTMEAFLAGQVSPVFFGSALTNFGIEPFFDSFSELAPAPRPTRAKNDKNEEVVVDPATPDFSGFVFKIQANMNPKHRDSMAFIRVSSGVFERDLVATHVQSGKTVRLSRAFSMVAQGRETTEVGFPGDIVGIINPGYLSIGDTLSSGQKIQYPPMPSFPPELIASIRPNDVMRRKQFEKGVAQLCSEGAVAMLRSYDHPLNPPYIAAVGRLQFDVLQYRLRDEYNVETILEMMPYRYSAWLTGDPKTLMKSQSSFLTLDARDRVVVLFSSEWEKRYLLEKNPQHGLQDFVAA